MDILVIDRNRLYREALASSLKTALPTARVTAQAGEAPARVIKNGQTVVIDKQSMNAGDIARLLTVPAEKASAARGFAKITRRERDVLRHLMQGSSNKEIAAALDLQVVTVKLHVRGICKKLGAGNRTQAALIARENLFE